LSAKAKKLPSERQLKVERLCRELQEAIREGGDRSLIAHHGYAYILGLVIARVRGVVIEMENGL
jgi:hypothetical protein